MLRKLTRKTLHVITVFICLLNLNWSFTQSTGNREIDSLLNLSKEYFTTHDLEQAELQAQIAFRLSSNKGNLLGMGMSLQAEAVSLMAKTKKVKSNRKKASQKLHESLEIFSSIYNTSLRVKSLTHLKWIALENKNLKEVVSYTKRIKDLNNLIRADNEASIQFKKSDLLSSKVHELSSKINSLSNEQLQSKLLILFQKSVVDSLEFQTERDSLMLFQKEAILAEQETEIALQKSKKLLYFALISILVIFVVFMFVRYKEVKKNSKILALNNEIIQKEREKSEGLLLNILPSKVANELKIKGKAQARKYDLATVFFSDFVNFSQIANKLSPEQLVALLDEYFTLFDSVIEEFRLEKIKTIGDAYMCVGGLPEKNTSHPTDAIQAALEIQTILNIKKIEKQKLNQPFFEARIGIHTGPLIAGVVGSKKFAFDIWGDTVNVASRLEASGEAGKVNISKSTFEQVKNEFSFISRGELPIKNLGEIQMFFVESK